MQTKNPVPRQWHAEQAESVLRGLGSIESGLSAAEVANRLREYGLNVLPEKGAKPLWRIVIGQFISPLIYILVAAAVVSAVIGDFKDAAFIAVVLLLNTIEDSRNILLLAMVLFENFHVGNCRSESRSAFYLSPLRSPVLFFGTLGAFLIHVVAMHVPFLQALLVTKPVDLWVWGVAFAVSVTIVPAIELHKWWWAMRDKKYASFRRV